MREAIDAIELGCMDRREHGFFKFDGKTIHVRNAGANFEAVKGTLRAIVNSNNIKEIRLLAHADCGAMKLVNSVLKEKKEFSDKVGSGLMEKINEVLIDQFRGIRFDSVEELCRKNNELQAEKLRAAFPGITITRGDEPVDVQKVTDTGSGHEHHSLYILKPSTKTYAGMIGGNQFDAYVLQAMSIEELKPDIAIALLLGQRSITLVAQSAEEFMTVRNDMNSLKVSPNIPSGLKETMTMVKVYKLPSKIM
jgi:hypothetical protein